MSKKNKIVIIGAGHVGSHCALSLCWRGIFDEVVLVDKIKEKASAQAMDIADSLSYPPSSVKVRSGEYEDCTDADIVVIAIGKARSPGQTRLDLLGDSVKMANELIDTLKKIEIKGIIISITNPADIVAEYIRKGLKKDRSKSFGTGTLLDTARLIRTLSEELSVDRTSITAFSMGEHGDSSMIPFSQIKIGGVPLEEFAKPDYERILTRTRMIGMDIINGKGSTEFGIGQSLAILAETIIKDKKTIFPVSVELKGEYNQQGFSCGVPCLIGKNGIEKVIEIKMTNEEKAQFENSCEVIKKHLLLAEEISPLTI